MMNVAEQVDLEQAALIDKARPALVEVHNGRRGHGSGVIWHSDGLIVTNAHVVGDGHVAVTLADGRDLPARVLARDRDRDLAALAIDAQDLPTVEPGDSRGLRPGQWVVALGHPWGVPGAITAGIVIGSGWPWPGLEIPPGAVGQAIAASLHLRPGHSGGPMLDSQGRLVGINMMIQGPDVGIAIPVHVVQDFLRRAGR